MKGTIEFTTETGSIYQVDYDKRTWARLSKTSKSGGIRQESGHLLHYPAIIVGQPCTMVDDSVLEGHDVHYVQTSRVLRAELLDEHTSRLAIEVVKAPEAN